MATELAKAYVQIIPSAKGIGKKIGEEVGGEDPGKTIGESMAGSIKKALAAAGIGVAVKKILSDAFSNPIRGHSQIHHPLTFQSHNHL